MIELITEKSIRNYTREELESPEMLRKRADYFKREKSRFDKNVEHQVMLDHVVNNRLMMLEGKAGFSEMFPESDLFEDQSDRGRYWEAVSDLCSYFLILEKYPYIADADSNTNQGYLGMLGIDEHMGSRDVIDFYKKFNRGEINNGF